MGRQKPSDNRWSLFLGQRSWSLLGVAVAIVAVGLAGLFVLMSGLLGEIWTAIVGVVLLLVCVLLGGYAIYNMVAQSRLEHHDTPSERAADKRLQQRRRQSRARDSERTDHTNSVG